MPTFICFIKNGIANSCKSGFRDCHNHRGICGITHRVTTKPASSKKNKPTTIFLSSDQFFMIISSPHYRFHQSWKQVHLPTQQHHQLTEAPMKHLQSLHTHLHMSFANHLQRQSSEPMHASGDTQTSAHTFFELRQNQVWNATPSGRICPTMTFAIARENLTGSPLLSI